jgi:hypothetical protein
MMELQPDTSLETLHDKLSKREFRECIELGNTILQDAKVRSGQGAAADYKISCYLAVGDAHFGLKQFQEALNEYEKARKFAEERFGPVSDEALKCIFRTERAVKALTAMEGLSADTNIRAATLLLEAEVAQQANAPQRPVRHSRTLQGIWAVALEKQKSHGKNPLVSLVEFIVNKLNTARLEEYLARICILISSTGLFCMAVYTLFWCYLHPNPTAVNPVPHGHFQSINSSRTHKGALWTFKTISGDNNTLAWSHDGKAQISETDVPGDTKLPVIVCNRSPGAMLAALVSSCTQNNLLLRWTGYSLQDQNGVVYYDSTEPEFAVAGKVYALENWAQKYFKDHGRYPTSGDIAYVNPISKRADKIVTINSKDLNDKFLSDICQTGPAAASAHPGMIACGAVGPRKFYIGALDRMKNPMPLLGSHNEFIVITPTTKSGAAELSEALTRVNGIVVFEEAVDSLSYFICAHTMLLFTSFVLVLGAVGPVIFLVTKNWRTAVRTTKKRPTVGEPSTR